jgi:phosphoglycerol transferase
MVKYLISVLCSIFLCVEIFCIKVLPVLKKTFPLENTDAVLFTLTQNVDGSRDFAISLVLDTLKQALFLTILLVLAAFVVLSIIHLLQKRNILKFYNRLSYKAIVVALNAVSIAIFAKNIYTDIPVSDYYVAWKDSFSTPQHSVFYQSEYVNPDSVQIEFKERRNLILIFLESMEYNFQDSVNGGNLKENLIPEITGYLKNEQSFVPGGVAVSGMGWTMADVVAKTCGIPLVFPPSIKGRVAPLTSFLPGTTCLTDLLIRNNYNVIVSQGTNLKFSGMDVFLKSHSSPEAYGLMYYLRDERVKKDSTTNWGVKDSLHYELIKEHISRISKEKKPWAVWMFTIDTHTPYGFLDSKCAPDPMVSKKKQMPYVIRCASRQVDSFIKWAKTQEWYGNTVIAVMGDHAMMAAPELVGFRDTSFTHYWLDFFINSSKDAGNYKREFTSLDMFPTILESMGAEIPNGALGLGRSLYSKEQTLLEKYGADFLSKAISKRSIEYDYFLFYRK